MSPAAGRAATEKPALRSRVWSALQAAGAARFPGARGRIPNFTGAEAAAARLAATPEWAAARALKSNPDAAQRPVRVAALRAGKVLYMAVPRLASARPFLVLDPAVLPARALWHASSIKGAAELGRPVELDEVPPLDLIVSGCVAVTRRGARLGKGGGYADLEYALLCERGVVGEHTPIATTVHAVQLVAAVPMMAHDLSIDLVATPDHLIRCRRRRARPPGILWDELDPAKRDAIPVLRGRT